MTVMVEHNCYSHLGNIYIIRLSFREIVILFESGGHLRDKTGGQSLTIVLSLYQVRMYSWVIHFRGLAPSPSSKTLKPPCLASGLETFLVSEKAPVIVTYPDHIHKWHFESNSTVCIID